MDQKKRKVSPQTKVKESQASKKRHRGLKGTNQGGQFMKGQQALHNIFQGAAHPVRESKRKQLPLFEEPRVAQTESYEYDAQGKVRDISDWDDAGEGQIHHGAVGNDEFNRAGHGRVGTPSSANEDLHNNYKQAMNQVKRQAGLSEDDPGAQDMALYWALDKQKLQHNGVAPSIAAAKEMLGLEVRRSRLPQQDVRGRGVLNMTDPETSERYQQGQVGKEHQWKTHRGTLAGSGQPTGSPTWEPKMGKDKETPSQLMGRLHPDHKEWLEQEMNREGSPFYGAKGNKTPGAYRRLRQYSDMYQEGYASDEAYGYVSSSAGNARKGPRKGTKSKRAPGQTQSMQEMAQEDIKSKGKPKAQGRSKKTGSMAPSHQGFGFGIQVPGVDQIEDLRKRFPDWSDADIFRYQTEQGQAVNEYALAANERWAHEQRAAMLKDHQTNDMERGDRVVVFTTNLGAPAVSVPANSLVGQYVVKKRKKMLVDNGYKRWQVKGEFPRAVRDMHVMEVSTGVSVGLQGRYGVFHNTGWRRGSKSSKGFGNQIPVGTQVLRDSAGRPVYDKNGNIRYTEGYTREISGGTKDVGMRIFIG